MRRAAGRSPRDPQDAPAARGGAVVASGERSIAIDTHGGPFLGVVSSGDHTTIVQLPPEALRPPVEVDAPPGLVKLEHLLGQGMFVGRARERAQLDTGFASDGAGGPVVRVIHGLGGVGKSTLAAHWADTQRDTANPIWSITADTPATLDAGLADLARALQPALAGLRTEDLRERAVQWLAGHRGWLLVLDNVDDPADVRPLLARLTTGRILITSRRASGWQDIAGPVRIDVPDPDEALATLTQVLTRSSGDPVDLTGAAELCAELGHLPLAVRQAGAYLAESRLSPRAYLRQLADHPAFMYHEAEEGYESERTMARVWQISLDRLADTPLAGQVLRVLAWFAPEAVPRSLLDHLGAPPAVQQAVRRLAAYSMITATGETLTVHRLVQALARTPDAEDPHRRPDDVAAALQQATKSLAAALPSTWIDPATWRTWRALLPHVDSLAQHTPSEGDTEAAATVLNSAGLFLFAQGQHRSAAVYFERAAVSRVRILGADHPDSLASRNNVAQGHWSTGDLDRAIALFEETLAATERVLGTDHPDTLTTRNNLGTAYSVTGDLGRAIPLLEQTLEDRVRVLGADHPETLTSRNNLADGYQGAGDLLRALPLFTTNLATMVRVLGPDHPDALVARHNLANAHLAAGDLRLATPMFRDCLDAMARVLGDENPLTLMARNNLASAYWTAGRLDEATPLVEETLEVMTRLLGPDHPDSRLVATNLAALRRARHRGGPTSPA
ncbi:FxSxx-COOH system tetratricopeptide repeat protein [Kitasatospora nipponensis]|uniref:FxSxx-COOH system tetratricopeptide repeat protein n=1 Tax=Kitasatospora nipponensis TaxID=258049 RepID=A0ABN1VSR0_9ACTN